MSIKTTSPVICIVGPSGAGKDTVVRKLMEKRPGQFRKFLSTTTRPAREGEKDGVDYNFISDSTYDTWLGGDKFLMSVEFAGVRYGTLRSEVVDGDLPLLMIVVESVAKNMREMVGARICAITVAPEIVKQRMLARGDSLDIVNSRLDADKDRAGQMMDLAEKVIYNHDLDEAIKSLDEWCKTVCADH